MNASIPKTSLFSSKRTRVISTILCIAGLAPLMVYVWGGISASTTTSREKALYGTSSSSTSPGNENRMEDDYDDVETKPAESPKRMHTILAYGDSLTAGVSGTKLFPYSKYLQDGLRQRGVVNVTVKHLGLPGWSSRGMIKGIQGPKAGLIPAIQSYTDPPVSIVVLLAGTNDFKVKSLTANALFQNLLQLH